MANSTMVGIGLTPEGINQNNVMYEFMMENAWRREPTDLTQWWDTLCYFSSCYICYYCAYTYYYVLLLSQSSHILS